MMKKILRSLCLFAAVDFAFVGAMNALAAEPIAYLDWDAANMRMTNAVCTTYEVVTEATATLKDGTWYVVTNTVGSLERLVTVNGSAHLILGDESSWYAGGVRVSDGNALSIYGQRDGTGRVISRPNRSGYAGIGGIKGESCGTVVINGGVVDADGEGTWNGSGGGFGDDGGPGIGSGSGAGGGTVTINGGTVIASGSYGGAGIGGGRSGGGAAVTINGGRVVAEGGRYGSNSSTTYGAGIGAGYGGSNPGTCETADRVLVEVSTAGSFHARVKQPEPTYVSVPYLDNNGEEQVCGNAIVFTDFTYRLDDGQWYVVTNGSHISRLDTIVVNGAAHLILADDSYLSVVGDEYCAAVRVNAGNSLTIYGQSGGTGELRARGDTGIGGEDRSCGIVTINGGTVTAIGEEYGAGIGGGDEGNGGTITINGGTVTAIGEEYGAGIGGGDDGACGTITINGGTVTAIGEYNGAGIGGGEYGDGGTITINGGTVTAIGEYYGAGIGGGYEGAGGTITINGGTVMATGEYYGSGIGGGEDGAGGMVAINGGTVTAIGEYYGAGIGGGDGGEQGTLAVAGGRVKANGYSCLYSTLQVTADIRVELDGVVKTPGEGGYVELSGYEGDLLAEDVDLIQYADVTYLDANGASQTRRCQVLEECRKYLCDGQWYAVPAGADLTNNWLCVVGSAHLVLCDGGKLTLTGEDAWSAGVCVSKGNELTIYGQTAGTGELFAQSGRDGYSGYYYAAGIGGYGSGAAVDCGKVTINGGTVTAVGVKHGAGIGGGYEGDGGTVVINGGTVTATGGVDSDGYGGAGIGGGYEGDGGTVVINGGTVTATGGVDSDGYGGAGIGGGYYGDGGEVTITGGAVTATGVESGAGIGGGGYGDGGTVTINGGTVTATSVGGYSAAGIGGGYGGDGATVTINGGEVTATGNKSGAGIGAASAVNGGEVTINGGTVTATGGESGAGIGGGSDGAAGMVTVNGGTVTATGGDSCTGIGPGREVTGVTNRGVSFGEDFRGFVYAGVDAASACENVQDGPDSYIYWETYVRIVPSVTLSIPAVPGCACIVSNATEEIRSARLNGVNTYRVAIDGAIDVYFALQPGSHWVKAPAANPMNLGTLTEDLAVDPAALPTVRQDPVAYLDWDEANRVMTNAVATVYEVVTETTDAFDRGRTYVVTGDVVIEKEDIGIRVDGTDVEPSRLVLCDGASLTVMGNPAILVTDEVDVTHGLVICGQTAGTGRLTVTCLGNLGGIGGGAEGEPIYGSYGACGAVTINGGTVTATGGYFGAGIGAGHRGGGCGTITINGGTVMATGGTYGAGIGGGYRNDGCGTVTINGGTVTAASGLGGAGIGGGFEDGLVGGYVTVTINGGTVKATGSVFNGGICAQAIGDAYMDSGATVTFDEGTIFEILAGDDAESATNVTAEAFSADHATLYASVESFQSVKVPVAVEGVSYVVSNATAEIAGDLAGGVNTYVVPKGDEVKIYFTLENDYLFDGEVVNPLELGRVMNNMVLTADELPKVISLGEKRNAAKAAIDAEAGKNPSAAVQKLVNTAKKAVDAAKTLDAIASAQESGLAAIAKQQAAEKEAAEKAAELAAAKDAAKAAIDAAAGKNPSAAVQKLVNTAKKAVDAAKTVDAIASAKQSGLTAIAEQLASEKAAAELAAAKDAAKAAIDAAAGDAARRRGELQTMVDAAKSAIDTAKTLDDVALARSTALAAIAEYLAVPELYENPASTPFTGDSTYYGWVRGADGSLAGSLTIKAAKAAKPEKGGQSKLTIQYTPFGGKKQTIKLDKSLFPVAGGNPTVDIPGIGAVTFGGASLAGAGLQAGKDLAKSKDKAEKASANARLASMNGVWTFALSTDAGYAAFSVTVKKGKGKLAGTLPDGTKVSLSVQGVLGDNALAIPFMYSKKSSLGFVFWVFDDGEVLVSDFTALRQPDGRALAVTQKAVSVTHRLADGAHVFATPFFEQTFEVAGKKWIFPKQQKKLGPDDPNPYGTKLTFTEKTGVVKGSFTVLDPAGKKQKYTVNGVVVGDVMYGSALFKKIGSVECAAE